MGRQADDDPGQGGAPGPGGGLPALIAAFERGGAWDAAAPSARLAAALEACAGPDGLYDGAESGALVGIARQWAAIESWAAAGTLAALRAMTREDAEGRPLTRRRTDLPDGWSDTLNYEIAGALAMGPQSAANLAALAWTLGTRLPGIGRLLADGTLTKAKARLIVQVFDPLTEDEATRAEALILGELKGKTWPQVQRLAWRAALTVAPDAAERRRAQAEKRRARVTIFREESGAAGLSGRDLPTAETLTGHANVLARAQLYEASGAFPDHTLSALQALAYLHLLNGVTTADAIAFARTDTTEPPPDTARPGPDDPGDPDDPDDDDRDDDAGNGADEDEADEGDGEADEAEADPRGEADRGADDHRNDSRSHDDDEGPEDGPGDGDDEGPADDGDGPGHGGVPGDGDPGDGEDPGGGSGPGDGDGGDGGPDVTGGPPVLPEVTAPLATLQGRAARPGDNRLLGPLDPALTRDLATAAARSSHAQWEITIVDDTGYAIGHGIARPPRRRRQQPQPPPGPATCALPARVNITATETLLSQLAAQPRPCAPPGDWQLTPRTPGDADGPWALTLPGGRELTVRFDVVPTHDCDHRYQVNTYQPGDRLRRLVQIRDHECTFPPCSRPAKESDFEHAIPYDQGGKTDACNAGARSRRCHQVKQMPGWTVTQPKPGWHQWTTPTGRTYIQEPWRYSALPATSAVRLRPSGWS